MGSFKVLQQRNCKAKCLASSNSMDILAILTFDGNLFLYRIWNWEKVHSIPYLDFKGSQPNLIEFSPDGKSLAIAGKEGLLCMLNTENGEIVNSMTTQSSNIFSEVIDMSWQLQDGKDKYR